MPFSPLALPLVGRLSHIYVIEGEGLVGSPAILTAPAVARCSLHCLVPSCIPLLAVAKRPFHPLPMERVLDLANKNREIRSISNCCICVFTEIMSYRKSQVRRIFFATFSGT